LYLEKHQTDIFSSIRWFKRELLYWSYCRFSKC